MSPSNSVVLRTALLREIERISEDEWCAGWLGDIEFMTYKDALSGKREYLADLLKLVDGWWMWKGEGADSGAEFVPWDEFRAAFDDWERRCDEAKKRTDALCKEQGHKTEGFGPKIWGHCMCGKVKAQAKAG